MAAARTTRTTVHVTTVSKWMWIYSMFVICPLLKVAWVEDVCPIPLVVDGCRYCDRFKYISKLLYSNWLFMLDTVSWFEVVNTDFVWARSC